MKKIFFHIRAYNNIKLKQRIYHGSVVLNCVRFLRTGHRDDDGRNSGSNLSKKQRKARTAFTDHQLQTLEKSFERQKYLSVQDRMELAAKLNLSDTQVKTWYQNRR